MSHSECFMRFWTRAWGVYFEYGGDFEDMEGVGDFLGVITWLKDLGWEDGSLMESVRDAGGPTGTMREPNSTPIVTSWWGEKRPSQRRMVSWGGELVGKVEREEGNSGVMRLYTRFTSAAVANADEFGDVVPWLGHSAEDVDNG